ncbi:MAG TPA: HlyD family efflux transporter periplasmic adaptor subunit [Marinobacter sp.]|nr:HlyD family efflux transporter periplasmic adaptor subunit [Marinobacter sp.]
MSSRLLKRLPVILGFALGVLLIVIFVARSPSPEWVDEGRSAVPVTFIEAQRLPFQLEARGHGVAHPSETWLAFASVAGRVVERHPKLESGAMLPEGTLLLALDPSRYELAIAAAKADLKSLAIEQEKLVTEEANTHRLLKLEQERLELSEQEYARIEKLSQSGTVARAKLDEQLRSTLVQRQSVTALENTLALVPARRDILKAQQEGATVRLDQARRDLEDTRFVAPYDLRLSKVDVELHQFVGTGQLLFQAENITAAEVEARIPFSTLRRLLGKATFSPDVTKSLEERLNLPALEAELELAGARNVRWKGQVVRISSGLDPDTRAARVVVQVDQPYANAQLPHAPPLQRDMYTRVRISAMSSEPLMVIPASAVHQGEIWLIDNDSHLIRRQVEVAFEQNDLAIIAEGLASGERVVVDDLSTAIQGMLLAPRQNNALQESLAARAAGAEQ